ncbi:MAG: thioesterase family protein [Deltaproteobacteria bacterium]|nr:thioesterase family protein [Kofleriaceae bacterium]
MTAFPWAPADLAADIAPVRVPGDAPRYTLSLPRHWDFLYPSGGVVTAAALRAAEDAIGDPTLRLISTSTIFCDPIQAGDVEIEVDLLRTGSAAVQVRVQLRFPGTAGAQLLATFARERPGPDIVGAAMPDVPPPAACIDLLADDGKNPHLKAPFFANVDVRLARGTRFWTPEFVAGPARYARWFRYRRPQRDRAGRFDRLAYAPIADTMPAALTHAIGPGPYRFYAPSLDLTLHVVDDTDREWILVSAYVRRARAGWAIGEAELWDDAGRLVAFASQAMYIRNIVGEPPVRDATKPA